MGNPPTEADQNVRINVLLLMQERGWSIDDLAKATGERVSRLERILDVEQSMELKDVWLMAQALDVEVGDLVGSGVAEPTPDAPSN